MKKVKELKTLEELKQFINLMKDEFKLTRFDLIENLVLYPAYFNYKVEFNYEEEDSAYYVSKFNLKIYGGADWGFRLPQVKEVTFWNSSGPLHLITK